MKSLFSLSILLTLISCNQGSSTSSSSTSNKNLNKIINLLESNKTPRGAIAITVSEGDKASVDFDRDTVEKVHLNESKRETLLSIEGNYEYVFIEEDFSSKNPRMLIEKRMSDNVFSVELQQFLKEYKPKLIGDRLSLGIFTELENQNNELTYIGKTRNTVSINLKNTFCDKILSSTLDLTYFFNGTTIPLKDMKVKQTTTCNGVASASKLKSLDLTSIDVCDTTLEDSDYRCEHDQNMEHLTDDL